MGDATDEQVWQQVLSGDARAFGVIWDRHNRRVMRHLAASGSDLADIDDLVATVFLELWQRRAGVRIVDGSVLPWLMVTAHNVHRNAARTRRRHRRFLATLPPPESTPDHAELHADRNDGRAADLRSAMKRCGPIDAALLALTAIEGLTAAEAAAALDLTEAAAKMRLSRVRRRLRTALETTPAVEGGA